MSLLATYKLVNLSRFNPHFTLDIHYATDDNFTGRKLYPFPFCYLHEEAAWALNGVQQDLEKQGLSLKVFDGFRPLEVQQVMWEAVQDERYVANPAKNKSRHTRGTAVDVTLVDESGLELEMPTPFDDFSDKAHLNAENISQKVKENRRILHHYMSKHGFESFFYEWWHFDLAGWNNDERYPIIPVSIQDLYENEMNLIRK
jgi:zinc D-Ala-D-Ala dipeptidase